MVIAKKHAAEELRDFRPTALISQAQTIWDIWLFDKRGNALRDTYGVLQYGSCKGRQCAEVASTLLRAREVARKRQAIFYKVDVR